MKTIVSILMFSLLLVSCGEKGYPVDDEVVPSKDYLVEKPGYSKIVIYRIVGHYRTNCNVKLSIDGDVIVPKMKQAENVTVYLPSGHHTFHGLLCERFETSLNVVVSDANRYNYAISVGPPDGFIIYDIGDGLDKD